MNHNDSEGSSSEWVWTDMTRCCLLTYLSLPVIERHVGGTQFIFINKVSTTSYVYLRCLSQRKLWREQCVRRRFVSTETKACIQAGITVTTAHICKKSSLLFETNPKFKKNVYAMSNDNLFAHAFSPDCSTSILFYKFVPSKLFFIVVKCLSFNVIHALCHLHLTRVLN